MLNTDDKRGSIPSRVWLSLSLGLLTTGCVLTPLLYAVYGCTHMLTLYFREFREGYFEATVITILVSTAPQNFR